MVQPNKMTSIQKIVDKVIEIHPGIEAKAVVMMLPDYNSRTIKSAYRRNINNAKKDAFNASVDISKELIKIIKDYKQPASARVQAIREYNNLVEKEPDKSGEDPYLKFLEKKSLRIATTIDTSSNQ